MTIPDKLYMEKNAYKFDIELRPCGTAFINQDSLIIVPACRYIKGLQRPLVDQGMSSYHSLSKISEFRTFFKHPSYRLFVVGLLLL